MILSLFKNKPNPMIGTFTYISPRNNWGEWEPISFFNFPVELIITIIEVKDVVRFNIHAEASYIDVLGRNRVYFLTTPGNSGEMRFVAGPREGGLHEPKIRIKTQSPQELRITWSASGVLFRDPKGPNTRGINN